MWTDVSEARTSSIIVLIMEAVQYFEILTAVKISILVSWLKIHVGIYLHVYTMCYNPEDRH
jgi:hypothetical protein